MLRAVLTIGFVAVAAHASLWGLNPFAAGEGFVPKEGRGRDGFMEPNNDLVRVPNRRHRSSVDHGDGFVPHNPNQPKELVEEEGERGDASKLKITSYQIQILATWPRGVIPKTGDEFLLWAKDNKINAQEWPPIQEPWR